MAAVCWGNLYIFVSLKSCVSFYGIKGGWTLLHPNSQHQKEGKASTGKLQNSPPISSKHKNKHGWHYHFEKWNLQEHGMTLMWCLVTTKRFQKSSGVIAFHSPNHQEQRPPGQLLEVPTPVPARGPARHTQLLGGLWGAETKMPYCTTIRTTHRTWQLNAAQISNTIYSNYDFYYLHLLFLWHDFFVELEHII